jgi:serine/threonine protein kinase
LVDHQGIPWSLDERLCKGGFGTIYSCTENDKVVVKTQPRSDDQLRKEERFYRDLRARLNEHDAAPSKYIPDLVTSGVANDVRFIVIERFPFDLQRFIDSIQLSKHDRCGMARQLISAIRFIHSFGYSHGDLKAKNVLVRSDGGNVSLYITDFGLARGGRPQQTLRPREHGVAAHRVAVWGFASLGQNERKEPRLER